MTERADAECPFCAHPFLTALLLLAGCLAIAVNLHLLWATVA